MSYYPPRPTFHTPSAAERNKIFGAFQYRDNGNGTIRILGGWESLNIVRVEVPQLVGVEGAPKNGIVLFHKKGAAQLQEFFEAVEAEGLKHLILTWAGSFYPRFIRGSRTSLSNHSWGTAFDINAAWNPLGRQPAADGAKGSVLRLVPIANEFGFFWGGHYNSRLDGMHFELAVPGRFSEKSLVAMNHTANQETAHEPVNEPLVVEVATAPPAPSPEKLPPSAPNGIASAAPVAELQTTVNSAGETQVEKTQQVAQGFTAQDFTAYIPQIDTAKRYLKTLTSLTGLGAVGAFFGGLPQWIVISLFALLAIIVIGGIVIVVKYHDRIFAYITAMNTLRATEGNHNPIVTSDKPE